MEVLNYVREYAAGFRMPNLSKIWYGQDEVDSGSNESILIQVNQSNILNIIYYVVFKSILLFLFL